MRGAVPINLASQPFRRDRPFHVTVLAATTVLTGLLAVQVSIGLVERDLRAGLQQDLDKLQAGVQKLAVERSAVEAGLQKPGAAEAVDYAVFLNGLLLRKGISWTRIFSDLESVMPPKVRLVSVRPQVNQDNQIQLDMTVAAADPPPVIDMVMKLEASSVFGATAVTSWLPPSQSEPLFRYRINVNYAPQL